MVNAYDSREKAKYLAVITSIYDYLSQQDVAHVQKAIKQANLAHWIWHGDGFVSVDKVNRRTCFCRILKNPCSSFELET